MRSQSLSIPASPVRSALEAGDFVRARDLIAELSASPSAALLELRARAAYGTGDLEGTLTAYGELYRFHLEAGNSLKAALAEVMVGMYLMMNTA